MLFQISLYSLRSEIPYDPLIWPEPDRFYMQGLLNFTYNFLTQNCFLLHLVKSPSVSDSYKPRESCPLWFTLQSVHPAWGSCVSVVLEFRAAVTQNFCSRCAVQVMQNKRKSCVRSLYIKNLTGGKRGVMDWDYPYSRGGQQIHLKNKSQALIGRSAAW